MAITWRYHSARSIAVLVLLIPVGAAGAHWGPRAWRVSMGIRGDLGNEYPPPALATGVWSTNPLILGIEAQRDRTVLYRLGWPSQSATTTGSASPSETGIWPDAPALMTFPPLPANTTEIAIAAARESSILAWAQQDGFGNAPSYRIGLRRFAPDGLVAHPDVIVQVGPANPSELAVAIDQKGHAVVAWTNRLPGRDASLRWRFAGPDGTLGPIQSAEESSSDQGSPSVVPLEDGFGISYLQTLVASDPFAPETPPTSDPKRAIHFIQLRPEDGAPIRDSKVLADRRGIDFPILIRANESVVAFWMDRRAGGRVLKWRSRSHGKSAQIVPWRPEGALRTDLRWDETTPFLIGETADRQWLVVWLQLEGRGRPMVLQGRLFHTSGDAAGPPILIGRNSGRVLLRSLLASPTRDRWIALWQEEVAGRFGLRYRPIRRVAGRSRS